MRQASFLCQIRTDIRLAISSCQITFLPRLISFVCGSVREVAFISGIFIKFSTFYFFSRRNSSSLLPIALYNSQILFPLNMTRLFKVASPLQYCAFPFQVKLHFTGFSTSAIPLKEVSGLSMSQGPYQFRSLDYSTPVYISVGYTFISAPL